MVYNSCQLVPCMGMITKRYMTLPLLSAVTTANPPATVAGFRCCDNCGPYAQVCVRIVSFMQLEASDAIS